MAAQDNRLDFLRTDISRLFGSLFVPTLLGMLGNSLVCVADGIFVGRGVGSAALAAVNIASPVYLIATGLGLMFGSSAGVLAARHLSEGRREEAAQCIKLALAASALLMLAFIAAVLPNCPQTAALLGAEGRTVDLAASYLLWVMPGLVFCTITSIGMFVIRLDGAPLYAMLCDLLPAAVNFALDYVLIMRLDMGIEGAAIATTLAEVAGGALVAAYLLKGSKTMPLGIGRAATAQKGVQNQDNVEGQPTGSPAREQRQRARQKTPQEPRHSPLQETRRMAALGAGALLADLAISIMMLVGNHAYMHLLGEDGVAAFGVACYLLPIIFMVADSAAAAASPIWSLNADAGNRQRTRQCLTKALTTALALTMLLSLPLFLGSDLVSACFLTAGSRAHEICAHGLRLFALSFMPLAANIVLIGYLQALEKALPSAIFTFLRGYALLLPGFWLLPVLTGTDGLWLAQPLAEALCLVALTFWLNNPRRLKDYN